ncbi:MAG: M15 family peptidase [Proteobacteria bacterium]|nr:M15 family peptidase [Pseudomonadota bacterium]
MFLLSQPSIDKLGTVAEPLARVVKHAIQITPQDFAVCEGRRSDADQLKAWLTGHSKLNGIPIGQTRDGYRGTGRGNHQDGTAVDLVPIADGAPSFAQWPPFFAIALAMRNAARAENVLIRWGGVWDRSLVELGDDMQAEMNAYTKRHAGPDFLDGPHFELHV